MTDICSNGFDGYLRASAVTSENLQIISSFQSVLMTDTGLVFGCWYHVEAGQVCIFSMLNL